HGAVLAAPEPPRRCGLALEAEGDEGRQQELVLALDTEAAAMTAGAARILAQRVAHDANRRQPRLHDLDRVVARGGACEDDHRRLAVERRPRPGAAGVEITLDEEPAGLGMRAERDRRHLVAVGSGGPR